MKKIVILVCVVFDLVGCREIVQTPKCPSGSKLIMRDGSFLAIICYDSINHKLWSVSSYGRGIGGSNLGGDYITTEIKIK